MREPCELLHMLNEMASYHAQFFTQIALHWAFRGHWHCVFHTLDDKHPPEEGRDWLGLYPGHFHLISLVYIPMLSEYR